MTTDERGTGTCTHMGATLAIQLEHPGMVWCWLNSSTAEDACLTCVHTCVYAGCIFEVHLHPDLRIYMLCLSVMLPCHSKHLMDE